MELYLLLILRVNAAAPTAASPQPNLIWLQELGLMQLQNFRLLSSDPQSRNFTPLTP